MASRALLGSRPWYSPFPVRSRRRRTDWFAPPVRFVATCDLCGEPIMSNESYHMTGCSIAHIRCEREHEPIWEGRFGRNGHGGANS